MDSSESEVIDSIRPYYIWCIGDNKLLSRMNKEVPLSDIYGGIDKFCAYVPIINVPYALQENIFVKNHDGIIKIQVLANLCESLQSESVIENIAQYTISNPSQVEIETIKPVTSMSGKYSHVMSLKITNPETLNTVNISFNYPYVAQWIEDSNDDKGETGKNDKTTGIKYLITGVAEAYKSYTECCQFSISLKNK